VYTQSADSGRWLGRMLRRTSSGATPIPSGRKIDEVGSRPNMSHPPVGSWRPLFAFLAST
jgi:hypothetical protein